MNTVQLLNLILAIVLLLISILGLLALIIIFRIRNRKSQVKKEQEIITNGNIATSKDTSKLITRAGEEINSIYKFMEFDSITDSMIIRRNSRQFVMVIECKGINYDLLSEDEKNAVEAGFVALLNTLRFPIQLYVQTRTLNLRGLVNKYSARTEDIKDQISKIDLKRREALSRGDQETAQKMQMEIRRKQNIYEYGKSIEDYTVKISGNKNILQQKMYIIISYNPAEYGDISKYSKSEISDICFSELYTRSQSVIRALMSAEVSGRVLSSEELAELLYVAYNRDASERYTLNDALNAEYDRLYSTARDVLDEKKKRIEQKIEQDAQRLATRSLLKADQINRQERIKKIKQRAKEMVEEYKDELSKPLYEETQKQIDNATFENNVNQAKPSIIRNIQ